MSDSPHESNDPAPAGRQKLELLPDAREFADGPAGFESWVRLCQQRLFNYARRRVRSDAEAEDILQDALVMIWRWLWPERHFMSPSVFTGACYNFIRYAAVNHIRKKKSEEKGVEKLKLVAVDTTDSALGVQISPDTAAEYRELRDDVQSLHEPQRSIVFMYYFLSMSDEQIAQILGFPGGPWVRFQRCKALQALQQKQK
jgi:RNA polymerase sigma factor (sigma-70 family)